MNDEVILVLKLYDQIFRAARYTVDDFPLNVLDALRDCLSQIATANDQFAHSHAYQMGLYAAACGFDFG
jgi:hypothetical protein